MALGKKTGGRQSGTPNQATGKARVAIMALLDKYSGRLEELLDAIEREHGPREAWRCVMEIAEFGIPKLARTEVVGDGGGPVKVQATPLDERI